jgi:hypothetical protein
MRTPRSHGQPHPPLPKSAYRYGRVFGQTQLASRAIQKGDVIPDCFKGRACISADRNLRNPPPPSLPRKGGGF